jgi:enoyl-CoA hydratase/carnithine racemase
LFNLDVAEDIAVLTLENPPVNALSRKWADEFHAHLDQLEGRNDWRVLRVRSGLKLFSAGGDIKEFASRLDQPDAGLLLSEEAAYYQTLFARIAGLPQISIAEVQGVAAGGGMEIALACDLRIAGSRARLGLPEVGLGLLPSAGGTQRMTRLIGRGRALRLIGGAELVDAEEAYRLGLVEWLVPHEEFAARAEAIARHFAAQPLEALQAAKSCVGAATQDGDKGFELEAEAPRYLMKSRETQARIKDFINRTASGK